MEGKAMICPKCGATMNEHAEKLIDPRNQEDAVDTALGGVVYEVYACPKCGASASRMVAA